MIAVFASCDEGSVAPKQEARYTISNADAKSVAAISRWLNAPANGRVKDDFDNYNFEQLQAVTDTESGYQLLSVVNTINNNEALSFSLDGNGEVSIAFTTATIQEANGDIANHVYTIDGLHAITFVDHINGARSVTYDNTNLGDWWGHFDDCVGKFHNLTPSNVGNIVVGAIFNVSTFGLYTPLSLVLCAGYASFK